MLVLWIKANFAPSTLQSFDIQHIWRARRKIKVVIADVYHRHH